MSGWLAVVSADHVARGVAGGFAQVNHGKRAGLDRLRPGDWLVYYSPRQGMREGAVVQAFTAAAQVDDVEPWQEDLVDWKPWRRRVSYVSDTRQVPIDELRAGLDMCASPNWGYSLRRGLLPLTDGDVTAVVAAMTGGRVRVRQAVGP